MTSTETNASDGDQVLAEARALARDYGLGEEVSLRPLPEGYANTNYALETSTGTFLYRICRQKSKSDIADELKVLECLKTRGFRAAYPIRRDDGELISATPSGLVVLYSFIEGEEPELTPETAGEAAEALARLHGIEPPGDFDKTNFIQIENSQELASRFGESIHGDRQILGRFLDETARLRDLLGDEPLPRGLIHADLFPENTIFRENRLEAIIDFEECCIDSFLFDVGTAINGFCFIDNILEHGLLRRFLANYNSVRAFDQTERRLLPASIHWGAHGQVCWHLDLLSGRDYARSRNRVHELLDRLEVLRTLDLASLCSLED